MGNFELRGGPILDGVHSHLPPVEAKDSAKDIEARPFSCAIDHPDLKPDPSKHHMIIVTCSSEAMVQMYFHKTKNLEIIFDDTKVNAKYRGKWWEAEGRIYFKLEPTNGQHPEYLFQHAGVPFDKAVKIENRMTFSFPANTTVLSIWGILSTTVPLHPPKDDDVQ